jgi:hypothetical protein
LLDALKDRNTPDVVRSVLERLTGVKKDASSDVAPDAFDPVKPNRTWFRPPSSSRIHKSRLMGPHSRIGVM